jgi:MerR family transcriptional regulator, light-induced transcriptional regulator
MTSNYSIKDLERLSGIKAHTIRIWEQRYNILSPDRTDTNIRTYNDEELKLILNIASLVRAGGKISHIVKLKPKEICNRIQDLVANPTNINEFFCLQIDNLVIAMIDLDDSKFDKIISTSAIKYGFEETMLQIIFPFLSKVGIMWRTGEVSVLQEHFISNLIRSKILVAIDGYSGTQGADAEKWLLFLPEGELHEMGLLFSKYLLNSRGRHVMYFGQSMPGDEIAHYCQEKTPAYLLTFFTAAYSEDQIVQYLEKLSTRVNNSTILVAGGQVQGWIPKWSNVKFLSNVNDLLHIIGPASK